MNQPKLSWNPIRYIEPILATGKPTLDEFFTQAQEVFDLRYIELYHHLLGSREATHVDQVHRLLEERGLGMSMFTCAPDLTHPDPEMRRNELKEMKENVQIAKRLGATGCRVTIGCEHDGVSRQQGIDWAVEALERLAKYAEPLGVKLGIENHYRDRRWTRNDFAFHTDVFLEVFDRVKDTPIGVNFDMSNQVMTGRDPMEVLDAVKHKVWHVHANDRLPGSYQHTVVGEGTVDFYPIFRALREVNYNGFISLEDGTLEGDAGTHRSFAFLRKMIDRYWSNSNKDILLRNVK